jgi:hypothetical protein
MAKPEDFNCGELVKRVKADNPGIYDTTLAQGCPAATHYLGSMVIAPGEDYHFYRKNDDGRWSHKAGYKPPTTLDAAGVPIANPESADRKYGERLNYKDFCGFQCIPRDPHIKHMRMANNSDNSIRNKNPAFNETRKNFHYNSTPPITDPNLIQQIVRTIVSQRNHKPLSIQPPPPPPPNGSPNSLPNGGLRSPAMVMMK